MNIINQSEFCVRLTRQSSCSLFIQSRWSGSCARSPCFGPYPRTLISKCRLRVLLMKESRICLDDPDYLARWFRIEYLLRGNVARARKNSPTILFARLSQDKNLRKHRKHSQQLNPVNKQTKSELFREKRSVASLESKPIQLFCREPSSRRIKSVVFKLVIKFTFCSFPSLSSFYLPLSLYLLLQTSSFLLFLQAQLLFINPSVTDTRQILASCPRQNYNSTSNSNSDCPRHTAHIYIPTTTPSPFE